MNVSDEAGIVVAVTPKFASFKDDKVSENH